MRILFTSDWQADYGNLDLCQQAAEEILRLTKERQVQALVHCGDVKMMYNPVDVRVTNFMVRWIAKWRQAGLLVYVLLGNHDRVGLHVDKQNWFPALRKAGAACADFPVHQSFQDGTEICFLPYRENPVQTKAEAAELLGRVRNKRKAVLVFHGDLQGAKYNVLSGSQSSLRLKHLHPESYMATIGGHIHMQQALGHGAWYVGSPFATDWGEANQQKGYILVDMGKMALERIKSRIPGWYDPSWPGFREQANWKGARVRIHVQCDAARDVVQHLEEAKKRAAEKYKGAEIVAVAEFAGQEAEQKSGIGLKDTDDEKIRKYVEQTCPRVLLKRKEKVIRYLVEVLGQVGNGGRNGSKLRVESVAGKNFLSFKDFALTFEKGLTVIAGENRDRAGKSNGAGKTSALAPLSLTWFGQTFKGQKYGRWVRRGLGEKEASWVVTRARDGKDRKIVVARLRRPKVGLRAWVDGKELSTGNRTGSKKSGEMQEAVERLIGYTWETLSNVVYVDQRRENLMLSGTEAERKLFLNRLQNLERFEWAAQSVKEQARTTADMVTLWNQKLMRVHELQNQLRDLMRQTRGLGVSEEAARKILQVARKKYKEALERKTTRDKKLLAEQKQHITRAMLLGKDAVAWAEKKAGARTQILSARKVRDELGELTGKCPQCLQRVPKEHVQRIQRWLDGQIKVWSLTEQEARMKETKLRGEQDEIKKRIEELQDQLDRNDIQDLRVELRVVRERWEEARSRQEMMEEWGKRKLRLVAREEELEKIKEQTQWRQRMLEYAGQVFSRKGLPAFLNAQICPQLNRAAEMYAELFTGKEIQVQFAIGQGGELDVRVINATGGEEVEDQSSGEMRMASLITSFALRHVAPETNILILDEPGEGLDGNSARQFARGLRKAAERFETILLTTHNQHILSELADVKLLTVVKEKGVSRLVED